MSLFHLLATTGGNPPAPAWISHLYGTGGTILETYGVAIDASSNVFAASYGGSSGGGGVDTDGLVTKQANDGTASAQWSVDWDGTFAQSEIFNNVAVGGSGVVYIGGSTDVTVGVLMKFANNLSSVTWGKSIDQYGSPPEVAICSDSSDNIYFVTGDASVRAYMQKLNSSGTSQWSLEINTPYVAQPCIQVDASGNVGVVIQAAVAAKTFVAVFNSSGTLQWKRQLSVTDYANGGAFDASGNFYVSVVRSSYPYLIKYNSSGTLQWQRKFGDSEAFGRCFGSGVGIDKDGYIYLAFGTHIAKYDSSGAIQWQRYISSGTGKIRGFCVDQKLPRLAVSFNKSVLYIPQDGTKTGTYTNNAITYDYGVSTGAETAGALTDGTTTYAESAGYDRTSAHTYYHSATIGTTYAPTYL